MRRAAAILVALVASAVILVVGSGAGGDEGTYQVRAIFDNGAFLVPGEEVRIAGANVGVIDDVTVTSETEAARADGSPDPGKAVVVLQIDDPGFQDFREDASCLIRPQSLLGEKYVECEPTQPRAPGTEAPPELAVIADGETGAGERFLPLESNGKAVDLDLVNNIMREPYADRFRLILNDLGAGLAARGDDLAEIIERADPALKETNAVLAILARENHQLAELARNGDAALEPLARDRERIGHFINSATVTAEATAERSADLERNFALLPQTLREVRSTMTDLKAFSEAGIPTFTQLAAAAPAATRATKALGPFANSSEIALESLGDAAAASQSPLVKSDPLIKQIRKLAKSGAPATSNLSKFLRSLDQHGGFKNLLRFVYRAVGAFNAFDDFGHFARAFLLITNCNDYETTTLLIDCVANFKAPLETTAKAGQGKKGHKHERGTQQGAEGGNGQGGQGSVQTEPSPAPGEQPAPPETSPGDDVVPPLETDPTTPTTPTEPAPDDTNPPDVGVTPTSSGRAQMRDARSLLDFLIGSTEDHHGHKGKKR
ncbi:MAG: MlaD family protein [Vicinamibacteria bacterium]|jgi:ABC-type transporter Mla subunit MlaD